MSNIQLFKPEGKEITYYVTTSQECKVEAVERHNASELSDGILIGILICFVVFIGFVAGKLTQ